MASGKKGATGLYVIIIFKLLKGAFFLSLAFGLFGLVDKALPAVFRRLLTELHLDPERQFFLNLEAQLQLVTPKELIGLASGSFLYSLPSTAEALGLIFRRPWAGWMAIGESSFFIPIEVYELFKHYRTALLAILIANVMIVWYLYRNRARLFAHHHHGGEKPEGEKPEGRNPDPRKTAA